MVEAVIEPEPAKTDAQPLQKSDDLDDLVKDPRAENDFSKQCNDAIASSEVLKAAGKWNEGLEALLAVEKKARNCYDGTSVRKLCVYIVGYYFDNNDLPNALLQIRTLCKKRSQLKQAIVAVVQLSMGWIDKMPGKPEKYELIAAINDITEGKIFVEVHRARLLRILAKMKEEEGQIDQAATLMQEIQVETCGQMDYHEKAEMLLEQMRLVLLRKDFVRCQIISKKIPQRTLDSPDFQSVRLRFYGYMLRYWQNQEDYMEMHNCCARCLTTPILKEADDGETLLKDEIVEQLKPFLPSDWNPQNAYRWYLECAVVCLLLTRRTEQQIETCRKFQQQYGRALLKSPSLNVMLDESLTQKIILFNNKTTDELKSHPIFRDNDPLDNSVDRWSLLYKAFLQRNLGVIAAVYSRQRISSIANILKTAEQETEENLCQLVRSKTIVCKIDRPAGIVAFGPTKREESTLTRWTQSMAEVIDMVETASYLLEKEKAIRSK